MSVTAPYVDGSYVHASPDWHMADSPWKARQIMRVIDVESLPPSPKFCDVGCGAGGVVAALDRLLQKAGIEAEFTGYDIAPWAIDRARELWSEPPRVEFECADVLDCDTLDFDFCLIMDVLEHLENPREFLLQLQRRGLRRFIIHLPLENDWLSIMRGRTDPRRSPVGHLHFFDTHSAISLFERSGLEIVRRVYTPTADHDFWTHPTVGSLLAYLPRKLLSMIAPTLGVHTVGGAAMMLHCRSK